jgi:hypothetical protein
MTNKSMEILNRRTRIRRSLLRNESLKAIAAAEGIAVQGIYRLAIRWKIPILRGIPQCLPAWGLQ